ncbi:MAG TPA: serine/threonine-protein kinase [Labilithrix sp.]
MQRAVGSTLGKYRIEGVLRETGLRIVYRATHLERGAAVAIHTLAGHEHDAYGMRALLAEAMITARLRGPHTPRALDLERDGDASFIVTEPLDGWWLADAIAERGPLAEAEAIRWLGEALDALCDLHALQFVHRDVKPGNMVVVEGSNGEPRLVLCGLGVVLRLDGPSWNENGMMIGTPAYMAPEQIRSPKVDARADVWSWGVSLYQAMSGRLPFPAASAPEAALAILDRPHVPLTGVSAAIARIVDRCLEKDPSARFADARELRDAMRPLQTS